MNLYHICRSNNTVAPLAHCEHAYIKLKNKMLNQLRYWLPSAVFKMQDGRCQISIIHNIKRFLFMYMYELRVLCCDIILSSVFSLFDGCSMNLLQQSDTSQQQWLVRLNYGYSLQMRKTCLLCSCKQHTSSDCLKLLLPGQTRAQWVCLLSPDRFQSWSVASS